MRARVTVTTVHARSPLPNFLKAAVGERQLVADTCLNDTCAAFSASTSRLNQALIERKTRFGLTCDFVGIREFVSKVLESD